MSSGISLPLTSSNLALVESCHGNAAVVAYVAEQAAAHSHVHLFAQPLSKNLVSLRTSRRTATAGGSHKQSRLGSPPLDISKHTALLNSAHPCEIKDACPSTPIKGDGLERARRLKERRARRRAKADVIRMPKKISQVFSRRDVKLTGSISAHKRLISTRKLKPGRVTLAQQNFLGILNKGSTSGPVTVCPPIIAKAFSEACFLDSNCDQEIAEKKTHLPASKFADVTRAVRSTDSRHGTEPDSMREAPARNSRATESSRKKIGVSRRMFRVFQKYKASAKEKRSQHKQIGTHASLASWRGPAWTARSTRAACAHGITGESSCSEASLCLVGGENESNSQTSSLTSPTPASSMLSSIDQTQEATNPPRGHMPTGTGAERSSSSLHKSLYHRPSPLKVPGTNGKRSVAEGCTDSTAPLSMNHSRNIDKVDRHVKRKQDCLGSSTNIWSDKTQEAFHYNPGWRKKVSETTSSLRQPFMMALRRSASHDLANIHLRKEAGHLQSASEHIPDRNEDTNHPQSIRTPNPCARYIEPCWGKFQVAKADIDCSQDCVSWTRRCCQDETTTSVLHNLDQALSNTVEHVLQATPTWMCRPKLKSLEPLVGSLP